MLKTPLTRRSLERVHAHKLRSVQLARDAAATSQAVSERKSELLKKGIPVAILLITGTYFGKRLVDRYRYHRKISRFEQARQHEAPGSVSMSAEELAAADRDEAGGGLTVFDVLNGVIAVVALVRRLRATTEDPVNGGENAGEAASEPDDMSRPL